MRPSVTIVGTTGQLRRNAQFEHENLATLPTEGKIVLICKSGTRASAAAVALRNVGFEQTYVLKGGLKALAGYLGPKEANGPMGPKAAAR